MENAESTQLAPKPATALVACSDTIFASGNKIVDRKLLDQRKLVSTKDSTNLTLYLNEFYGNRPLANHVAELTLLSIVTNPNVLPAVQSVISTDDLADWWEDFWDGGDEPSDGLTPQPTAKSRKKPAFPELFAIPLRSGLALLVESRIEGEEISYYAIGVSPDPATIPPQT